MDSMETPTSHGKTKSMVKTYPFIVAGKDRMSNCHFLNLHLVDGSRASTGYYGPITFQGLQTNQKETT
jgi:hypothetical protein